MNKVLPKSFFESENKCNSYLDDVGYCVNCGWLVCRDKMQKHNSKVDRVDPGLFFAISAHGYVRLVDIKCECGSTKGLHDIDVENYRAWDITEKK